MSDDKKYIINVNGVEREMTPEERQTKDNLLSEAEVEQTAKVNFITERDNARASAKEKLIALGLTSKEVDCVMWGTFLKETSEE